jgi:hypothetical protein
MNINMNSMKSPECYQFNVKELIDGSYKNISLNLTITYLENSAEVTTRVKEILALLRGGIVGQYESYLKQLQDSNKIVYQIQRVELD